MIFGTSGSAPFPRLVTWIESIADEVDDEILIQTANQHIDTTLETVDFLDMAKYRKTVEEARLVIGHAGIGTILTALEKETPIIVVPRRAEFNEHGDNHQVVTAKRFETKNLVVTAKSQGELRATTTSNNLPISYSTENTLSSHLEKIIQDT